MRAIVHEEVGGVEVLKEIDVEAPKPRARDLVVEVRAVSMNPVDVKVRAGLAPEGGPRVLGYDAAGIVREVGAEVGRFRVGDAVYYAGDLTRPGTNAELHAVDERIVGHKPESLSFLDAAALPLTTITAWEILFDSFRLREGEGSGDTLLVIGGAGGVGSILIQLAKKLTGLRVVATASRPETVAWVEQMGADEVVNHREPLAQQLEIAPRYVASLTATDQHYPAIIDLIAPRGTISVIDDPTTLDALPLKLKALTLAWEFMFARPMFQTQDIDAQRELLNRTAALVDAGKVQATSREHIGAMTLDNIRRAHEAQESGKMIGKTVLEGFQA